MKAQLLKWSDGSYIADFMFDDAPRGLEDHLENSVFHKRLLDGRAYAEYGRPDTSHLSSNPYQDAVRYMTIEERQICGHLSAVNIHDGLRLIFRPLGSMGHIATAALTQTPHAYGLELRMVFTPDDEDESIVNQLITADFVQL